MTFQFAASINPGGVQQLLEIEERLPDVSDNSGYYFIQKNASCEAKLVKCVIINGDQGQK